MDHEHKQSYHQVKTRIFAHDNKNKCQIKRTHFQLAFCLLLPQFCFEISAFSSKYRVEETTDLLKMEATQ